MIFINQWNPGDLVLVMLPTWFHKLIRGQTGCRAYPPIKYYSSGLFLCEISTTLGAIICPRVVVVELVDGCVRTFCVTLEDK